MRIDFERTANLNIVRQVLTNESIWPHIGDDFAPPIREFRPNDDPRIWYVLVIAGCRLAGLFMLVPESPVCWQIHVAMLPEARGQVAHQAGREIVPWIWAHTECRRIEAKVPQSNRAAVLYGLRAMGLRKFGVSEKSFLKHGRLWDQVLMGRSEEN